ncbi:MAG: hypothetical protein HQ507_09595 [Candidatus Marinimicrobia bacterium]|nr:hypothetical protein [Candidatus Neomarinimicrobiota bacterium]
MIIASTTIPTRQTALHILLTIFPRINSHNYGIKTAGLRGLGSQDTTQTQEVNRSTP